MLQKNTLLKSFYESQAIHSYTGTYYSRDSLNTFLCTE